MLKPDLIELESREEKIRFICQEVYKADDIKLEHGRDAIATYFSLMWNFRFKESEWDEEIMPLVKECCAIWGEFRWYF